MRRTHGLSRTPIYRTWCDMRDRCYNPKRERYPRYGGRGITVCDEWREYFTAFFDYVSKLEHFGEDGYTLDRIDVNGNYEPGNVRWATNAEQSRNRTDNHYIAIDGEKMILSDVAQVARVTRQTIYKRLSLGASEEQLLRKCHVDSWVVEINGQLMTIKEIAAIAEVHKSTITDRIKAGLTGAELLRPAFGAAKRYDVGDGRQLTINEIAAEAGISDSSVRERIQRGWTGEKLLKPARAK